ncbi:purple acid phosphatase family protein [Alloalcanivorax xenomutans]|uniref:purple acid phosphatase family protein n=1 Tax=Alloalcanivorax xenomutans TaxID=1094342 RepID=UPI003D9B8312
MDSRFTRRAIVRAILLGMASSTLTACGGGGSGSSPPSAPSTPSPNQTDDPETPEEPECPPEETAGAQPPRGLHASWTDHPHTTRTLTWFTDGTTDPGTRVQYGPVTGDADSCSLTNEAFPFEVTGTAHETYGVEALTHVATLTGLQAGQAVRYRVGSDNGGWSPTRVLAPTRINGFRFCHFGDHGLRDASQRVLSNVEDLAPDFFIVAGDLSYANGDQPVWDRYFDMLEPLAARVPVMTCPGNHENKDGGGQGYRTRVSQPGKGIYYGFDYNRVHFFFSTGGSLLTDLSSTTELLVELAAMEKDLAEAWRRRRDGEIDFIVFVQHYTLWTNCEGRDPANFALVAVEEQILLRYDVDLVLVGHDHVFERSHPMAYGKPSDNGYVQVTQGGGGQSLYELIEDPANWAAVSRVCHGFTVVDVEDRRIHARSYAVSDEDGNLYPEGEEILLDEFTLAPRVAAPTGITPLSTREQRPARSLAELDVDLNAMLKHTLQRNLTHDMNEMH